MPRYDFRCEKGHVFDAIVPSGEFVQVCPECYGVGERLPHYDSLQFKIPLSFHTDIRDVLGDPADVKEKVRKGELIPAGPGSRWV